MVAQQLGARPCRPSIIPGYADKTCALADVVGASHHDERLLAEAHLLPHCGRRAESWQRCTRCGVAQAAVAVARTMQARQRVEARSLRCCNRVHFAGRRCRARARAKSRGARACASRGARAGAWGVSDTQCFRGLRTLCVGRGKLFESIAPPTKLRTPGPAGSEVPHGRRARRGRGLCVHQRTSHRCGAASTTSSWSTRPSAHRRGPPYDAEPNSSAQLSCATRAAAGCRRGQAAADGGRAKSARGRRRVEVTSHARESTVNTWIGVLVGDTQLRLNEQITLQQVVSGKRRAARSDELHRRAGSVRASARGARVPGPRLYAAS